MTEEEKQKLNEKLAIWAGFRDVGFGYFRKYGEPEPITLIQRVYGGKLTKALNFTDFPDACFKWLVPKSKMDTLWIINNLDSPIPKIEYCFGFTRGKDNVVVCWSKDLPVEECLSPICKTPALAFCLAVEKLIDKEGK